MLHNRLYQQVQVVSKEQGANVKLDLLRIICTADILNIRLKTNTVSQYLNNKFQRTVDLNELYRQLENEYYLKFGDTFIEGLHPVRSSHLQRHFAFPHSSRRDIARYSSDDRRTAYL